MNPPTPDRNPLPNSPLIALRPFHEADTEFFAGLATDERVTRFVADGRPWDRQAIHDRVRAALAADPLGTVGASRWFLATEADVPVGVVVSTRKDAGVEIGYWVSPEHWGRGIAGAMLDGALDTIPGIYNARSVLARVDPANVVSAKLLTRRGFRFAANDSGLDHYLLGPIQS